MEDFNEIADINDELLCLAAVGTISDIVPLLGENRALVALGLEKINQKKHIGIAEVFESAQRNGEITSTDVAFVLTPRINAVGRLDTPDKAFELLTSKNPLTLKVAVEYLNNYNKMRQNLCDETFSEILDIIKKDSSPLKDSAIILLNSNWHVGIIGVVASNVVETFLKPAFLMTKDDNNIIKCSIRSPLGYNVYEILEKMSNCFLGFGGHAQAGGFSFDGNKYSFDEIKKKILDIFNDLYKDIKPENKLEIDAELEGCDINKELLEVVSCLEPYGEKNPSPIFCVKNAEYVSHKFVGKNSEHLKLECFKDGVALHCVWWGKNDFRVQKNFDIAFSPRLNVFNGAETIQLELRATSLEERADNGIKFYDHRGKTDVLKQVDEYLSNPEISIAIIAKKPATLDKISSYKHIFRRLYENETGCNLMFFDYPATYEEFAATIKNANACKVHLMKEEFEEDIQFYLKQLTGMLKFCSNKKEGFVEIEKMALSLGVSLEFIQIALEIFEREGAIKILESDKISFIKPIALENFSHNTMYEILDDEFKKIMDFKNIIQEANVAEIEEIISL
jgi:single-stranded-DNA-specific exonuclease